MKSNPNNYSKILLRHSYKNKSSNENKKLYLDKMLMYENISIKYLFKVVINNKEKTF